MELLNRGVWVAAVVPLDQLDDGAGGQVLAVGPEAELDATDDALADLRAGAGQADQEADLDVMHSIHRRRLPADHVRHVERPCRILFQQVTDFRNLA